MHALYAFARISDDLSDDCEAPNQAHQQLEAWGRDLDSQIQPTERLGPEKLKGPEGTTVSLQEYASLWPALQDASVQFEIPKDRLKEIVHGVSMDLDDSEIESWDDLENYCYHVASAVGLACTHIWSSGKTVPQESAVNCGIAFQLTNILRDVREDAAMGRIYLPNQLLNEYQINRTSWLAGEPDGNWEAMLQHVSDKAFELYHHGWETHRYLCRDGQKMFSLMWRSYHALLEAVVQSRHAIWNPQRITLRRSQKLGLAARHFIPPLYRRLAPP